MSSFEVETGVVVRGCIKFDLQRGEVAGEINFGQHVYGGECVFVAESEQLTAANEDKGYIMTYIHDEKTEQSYFVIYDAKTMDSRPVTKVPISSRVPYGFHGLHVTEKQIQAQPSNHNF